MVEKFKPGEKVFLKKYQELHGVTIEKSKELPLEEKKEKIKQAIEEIKKEIENLPEIKKEASFHPTMPADQLIGLLAQAIKITLDKGVREGFVFIYNETNNPYVIDAFHDILIGHFTHLISQ
jgi:phenylalanyl-tRNA synthetase alpha subunit